MTNLIDAKSRLRLPHLHRSLSYQLQ